MIVSSTSPSLSCAVLMAFAFYLSFQRNVQPTPESGWHSILSLLIVPHFHSHPECLPPLPLTPDMGSQGAGEEGLYRNSIYGLGSLAKLSSFPNSPHSQPAWQENRPLSIKSKCIENDLKVKDEIDREQSLQATIKYFGWNSIYTYLRPFAILPNI